MTQTKKTCSAELCYVLGLLLMSLATALMEKAGFGMSMVVAPAYLVHLKLSQLFPFFTFGMAEYTLQALLLLGLMVALRRFRLGFLFSFVTALCYGFALDGWLTLFHALPTQALPLRCLYFLLGVPLCALGVALFFHTYLPPEVYELIVIQVSRTAGLDAGRCKLAYDCISCAVSVLLSFLFFGFPHFVGIGLGTILCAFLNGPLISFFSARLEKRWDFVSAFPKLETFFLK